MCEEVRHPATQVPKAMVGTIILNTIMGLFFLIPLVFVMPGQEYLANIASGQPLPAIIKSAIGHNGGAFALTIPLLVLGLFCGTACTTATSRCTWAFARDGAIPGSKWWRTVNVKLDVPLNAMIMTSTIEVLLGLIYFGSSAAFNAFSGVGVICLTLAYACPIAVSVLEGRNLVSQGQFYKGKLGLVCNCLALGKFPQDSCFLSLLPIFWFPSLSTTSKSAANFIHSMVCPRHPAVLHAHGHSHHARVHELRLRGVLRVPRHLGRLVFRLGQEELPGPADARSRASPGGAETQLECGDVQVSNTAILKEIISNQQRKRNLLVRLMIYPMRARRWSFSWI